MIEVKTLEFENALAYGPKQLIDFTKSKVTQIIGSNGCLVGDTIIYMADGSFKFIKDLVAQNSRESVLTCNKHNEVQVGKILDAFSTGVKPVYEVQLDNGNKIRLTKNHKLKTPTGWSELGNLSVGSFIEDARYKYISKPNAYSEDEFNSWALLTYLMTEGGLSKTHELRTTFTNKDNRLVEDFLKYLHIHNPELGLSTTEAGCYRIVGGRKEVGQAKATYNLNKFKEFIPSECLGLCTEKFWPASLVHVSDETLYKILAIYIDTDGCIEPMNKIISFSTSNKRMAYALLHLIRDRLNIQSSIRRKTTYRKDNFEVSIHRYDECVKLLNLIREYLIVKKDKAEKLINQTSSSTSFTQDLVPKLHCTITGKKAPNSELSKALSSFKATKHGIRRLNYEKLITHNLIISDIDQNSYPNTTFCRIKAIKYVGEEEVFDLTTTHSNFIADGILVHNSGKSSLPILLEELFYSKNSKGVAKSDILNRYTEDKHYSLASNFSVHNINYRIEKVVKSSAKVTLLKEGEDISGHTATQTYKILEEILGMDFTTFTKLVYQSMNSSLDFLSATDTQRKKFLLDLLDLSKYSDIESELKEKRKNSKGEVSSLESSYEKLKGLVESTEIPDLMELKDLPALSTNYDEKISELNNLLGATQADKQFHEQKLRAYTQYLESKNRYDMTVEKCNKEVQEVESLKATLTSIDRPTISPEVLEGISKHETDIKKLEWERQNIKTNYSKYKAQAAKTKCGECGTELDVGTSVKLANELASQYKSLGLELDKHKTDLEKLKAVEHEYNAKLDDYNSYIKHKTDLENRLVKVIDTLDNLESMKVSEVEDPGQVSDLDTKIAELKDNIAQIRQAKLQEEAQIRQVQEHNLEASKNNAARDLALKNLQKAKDKLKPISEKLSEEKERLQELEVLCNIFGPKGLIGYKIESSVKVFESKLNEYLAYLSSGTFALGFELEDAKLQVVVYHSGKVVPIKTLSSGELAKVNIATLLAIRNLMSSISKSSINVLFLDEVVSVIDTEGMDDLIEVLLQEQDMNIFVVSHGREHPLVSILRVVKKNNISEVSYG